MLLKAGMNIPVDEVLIHGSGLLIDESAMTGESLEILKENLERCLIRKSEMS